MRAPSGLTRRSERLESIGVPLSSRRLLDLQCSGPDAPIVTPYRSPPRRLRTGGDARPSRESGFVPCPRPAIVIWPAQRRGWGGFLSLRLAVSTVRYPIPERTFGHISARYGGVNATNAVRCGAPRQ